MRNTVGNAKAPTGTSVGAFAYSESGTCVVETTGKGSADNEEERIGASETVEKYNMGI